MPTTKITAPNPAERLLLQNRAWAKAKRQADPAYFDRLKETQTPRFLWIGCSDSRVPADLITGTQPGEIFAHRNIANMVVQNDQNLASVLEYAVNNLKVEHIIVCGHHGCGGVRAAMTGKDYGLLNTWLNHIKQVYAEHFDELEAIADPQEKEDRLVELNAEFQLNNLMKSSVIQRAWDDGRGPSLHAWFYDLRDGVLNEMKHMPRGTPIPAPFRLEFEKP